MFSLIASAFRTSVAPRSASKPQVECHSVHGKADVTLRRVGELENAFAMTTPAGELPIPALEPFARGLVNATPLSNSSFVLLSAQFDKETGAGTTTVATFDVDEDLRVVRRTADAPDWTIFGCHHPLAVCPQAILILNRALCIRTGNWLATLPTGRLHPKDAWAFNQDATQLVFATVDNHSTADTMLRIERYHLAGAVPNKEVEPRTCALQLPSTFCDSSAASARSDASSSEDKPTFRINAAAFLGPNLVLAVEEASITRFIVVDADNNMLFNNELKHPHMDAPLPVTAMFPSGDALHCYSSWLGTTYVVREAAAPEAAAPEAAAAPQAPEAAEAALEAAAPEAAAQDVPQAAAAAMTRRATLKRSRTEA